MPMLSLPTRTMIWALTILTLILMSTPTNPEVVEPGPESGIVLKEQPGLLITNCRWHVQRIFVRFSPDAVRKKHIKGQADLTTWAGAMWLKDAVQHTEMDITHMLEQLQKFVITQHELSGVNRREKRFLGGLLTAASAVASLFSLGASSVNAVSLSNLKRQVADLQAEIPNIQKQMDVQDAHMQTVGKTLEGTVLVLNSHSDTLGKLAKALNTLIDITRVDQPRTELVMMLMSDLRRDISSSIDTLVMGRIPPYLVSLNLVQGILSTATRELVTPLQAHLAYTLGSSVPIYVNPEARELAFVVHLPVVTIDNIYRLKDVVNVGFWKGDTHVKVQTPPIVAYHDNNPNLYLAPNLRLCTITREIHYLCPSKPFVRDATGGLCGLKTLTGNSQCPTKLTPRRQVVDTQAEVVGQRWLVNTPARVATLTYDQHDTSTHIELPDNNMWMEVPEGAIVHIDDLALYHLLPEQYEAEIEVSDFFAKHPLELDANTVTRVLYEGSQMVDVGPVDAVLKEIESTRRRPFQPVTYAWSTPDTVIVVFVALSYLSMFTIGFLYLRRTRSLQLQVNRCTNRLNKCVWRKRPEPKPKCEPQPNPDEEVELRDSRESGSAAILDLIPEL